jgi:hypothetical protein
MGSEQQVIAQALGIAQGRVSKCIREIVRRSYPHPELDPDVLVRQQKEKIVIWYVCAGMGVSHRQTPFVLSGDGLLIPLYPEC